MRVSWATCIRVVANTTRNVSRVIARTSRVRSPTATLPPVPLELVVQGLDADPENGRRLRLVVADRGERLEDEEFLGLVDRRADGHEHGIRGLVGRDLDREAL